MKKIEPDKLKEILAAHALWARGAVGGSRADLRSADLRSANLSGANLSGANLSGTNLRSADLSGADLRSANLRSADLRSANLSGANLRSADLSGTNLRSADLRSANLIGADLSGTLNAEIAIAQTLIVPDVGAFEAWKKLSGGHVAHLRIPAKAKRLNASGRKCRASEAKVIAIYTRDGAKTGEAVPSSHDGTFFYQAGSTVKPHSFCEDRWEECSGGIHFFITRIEAEGYLS